MAQTEQRVTLVTGGAQGIGEGIVHRFHQGADVVVIADRQIERAHALAQGLSASGGPVIAMAADLASQSDCQALVSTIAARHGHLDVIVHNAGYFPLTPFAEISEAVLTRTLAVNLAAPFWLLQAALPLMQAQRRGRMLVTSSVTGPRVAYPGLCHYAASKAGVNGFIRAAALEMAPFGITVNGVEPGMIRTPAMNNLGDQALNQAIAQRIPLGRLGEPADIAEAMYFLASDAASYITGQTLVVDGGAILPESSAVLG